MKHLRMAISLLAMAFSALSVTAQTTPESDDDAKYATEMLKPGVPAPAFNLKTLDGKNFDSARLQGRYVVIDFWASWCPDCRKDAPNVVRMYNEFHKRGVEFIGVSFDTDREAWRKGVERFNIPYVQVSELKKFHNTDIAKAYGVKWIPALYLIGKDGKVILGTVLSDKLEKALNKLFDTK